MSTGRNEGQTLTITTNGTETKKFSSLLHRKEGEQNSMFSPSGLDPKLNFTGKEIAEEHSQSSDGGDGGIQDDRVVDLDHDLQNHPIREEHFNQLEETSNEPSFSVSKGRGISPGKSLSAHNLNDLYAQAEKLVEEIDEPLAETDRTKKTGSARSKQPSTGKRTQSKHKSRASYTTNSLQGQSRGGSRNKKYLTNQDMMGLEDANKF